MSERLAGESFTATSNGEPVARLSPVESGGGNQHGVLLSHG
ncbi:hypothetical protein [Candidatus Poriferisodalis sp.]